MTAGTHETICPPEFIALAGRLADAAGAVVRRYFRVPVEVEHKADDSPVTLADRESEAAMRAIIAEAYPDHGILGEELGSERADADYVWVLDPIDGTRNFITGRPIFGILVALAYRGRPILGVIDQPITGERWLGVVGATSTLNGDAIAVRPCAEIGRAALYTTGPEWFEGDDRAAFERLREAVNMCLYNADCYAFGLLASGFVDLAVEARLAPYDYCALVPVIEGAGGAITDWQGGRLSMSSDGRVLAAGDRTLHARALELLAG